jgi:hypothetical protein
MAATKQSADVNFSGPVVIAGTHIAAGDYTARWDATGSDVKVQILKGNKEIVSAPAKLVNKRNGNPGVETKTAGDGAATVTAINLSKVTLQFSE